MGWYIRIIEGVISESVHELGFACVFFSYDEESEDLNSLIIDVAEH